MTCAKQPRTRRHVVVAGTMDLCVGSLQRGRSVLPDRRLVGRRVADAALPRGPFFAWRMCFSTSRLKDCLYS